MFPQNVGTADGEDWGERQSEAPRGPGSLQSPWERSEEAACAMGKDGRDGDPEPRQRWGLQVTCDEARCDASKHKATCCPDF